MGARRDPMTMTAAESAHLRRALEQANRYLEYGAGASTILACETQNLETIMSVESDPAFAARLVSENSVLQEALQRGRMVFRLPDIGPTGAWGHPKDTSKRHLWPGYALCPYHHGFAPDLVLIDGRFRVACGLLAALELRTGAKVLVHDFRDRPKYHLLREFLNPLTETETLAEFEPNPKADLAKARRFLETYLYHPDDSPGGK